ncbi:hypothetical protein A5766_09900 [Gordonia sp. 852002-51296_SCH5728562-b]|nr:hypothetical protein A5766_09900 [Gordonia sp. 852002-51296_SCH5728562-b]
MTRQHRVTEAIPTGDVLHRRERDRSDVGHGVEQRRETGTHSHSDRRRRRRAREVIKVCTFDFVEA